MAERPSRCLGEPGIDIGGSRIFGEIVPREAVYPRTALFFEIGSENHARLDRMLALAVGRREPEAAIHEVFEIL